MAIFYIFYGILDDYIEIIEDDFLLENRIHILPRLK